MKTTTDLTKILAIAGTTLVCIPILAPILFSIVVLVQSGYFRLDYLMPAELSPLVLSGGCLLVWAAIRAHTYQRLISWGLGIAVGSLVGGQALAVITGLASGNSESLIWLGIVIASIIVYSLAVIAIDVGGMLLVRYLLRSSQTPIKSL